MKGVLFDLEVLNQLTKAINTKLLPSRKYQLRELPDAVYDVFFKEINRVKKEFHDLIYGPKASFIDEYGMIKRITSSCFRGRTDLEYVYFPACSRIHVGAFDGCINLSEISFPKVSFIEGMAFRSCLALTKLSGLSSATAFYAEIFNDCKNLSYVSLNWSKAAIGLFSGCDNLEHVNMPNLKVISGHAFMNCSKLSHINLDNAEVIMGSAFMNCISLEELSLPKCERIGSNFYIFDDLTSTFFNCVNLQKVYAPICSMACPSIFENCYNLSEIYMPMLHGIPYHFLKNGYGLRTISISAFYSAKGIGPSAFMHCWNLESAAFENVQAVNIYAFAGCSNLHEIAFYGDYDSAFASDFFVDNDRIESFFTHECVGLNNSAFTDCIQLSSIVFPNLNLICNNVFSNCINLSFISFSKCLYVGEKAFYNCYNLEEVHIPNCKYINRSAFYNCSKLSMIDAPSLSAIGTAAFENCKGLTAVSFPNASVYINELGSIIGSKLVSRIFYNCTSLQIVYMPQYVLDSRKTSLFENCINLENIVLSPEGNIIGSNMFRNCYKLSTFDFQSIVSIYTSAFENCSALTEVIAPNCTFLGPYTFKNCINLERIQISTFNSLVTINNKGAEIFANCYNLEEAIFGEGGYDIYGSSIFANCSKLRSFVDMTSGFIRTDAFLNCLSLSYVDLRLKRVIGRRAFANCQSLSEVHIFGFTDRYSANHKIVNDGLYLAFSGCINLQSLYIHGPNVVPYYPEKLTFYSCSFLDNGLLYVPSSLYSLYTASSMQWINYMSSNRIISF